MKLDRTLVREIKTTLYGNGEREAKFAALKKAKAACRDMSTTKIRDTFNDCIKEHGRAVVAVCVAATLRQRKERIDYWKFDWATEVLSLMPFFTLSNLESISIDDGIHPTAICEYAEKLIRYTTENA